MKFTSKKLIFTGVAILIILGAVAITQWDNFTNTENNPNTAALNREADTDNDGLKNWEETLWKTDPQNPDTDGDGDKDGAEVEENRHPKVAGPNDQLENQQVEIVYEQSASTSAVNRTDQAWESLAPYLASYISVPEGQQNISESEIQDITNEIASRADSSTSSKTYARADLSIIENPDFQQLDAYFENLTQEIAKQHSNSNIGDELLIFAQAASGNEINEKALVGLEVVATDYRALAENLSNIRVPTQVTETHINLLNNYQKLAQASEDMSTAVNDPVRSMVGIKNYRAIMDEQQQIQEQLGEQIGTAARNLLSS